MFVSLASVPTIMIWLLFCWPKMEDNKVEEKPEQTDESESSDKENIEDRKEETEDKKV